MIMVRVRTFRRRRPLGYARLLLLGELGWPAWTKKSKPDEDDRPPICPACGVTMGMIPADDGTTRHDACLECGFSDEMTSMSVSEDRARD